MRNSDRSSRIDVDGAIASARQILDAAYYSFLTTLDEDGNPTTRLLQHFDPDDDLTLRMGTSSGSRKVAHIEANPAVLVACQSPADHAYVTLSGTATILRYPSEKAKHWRDPWRAVWPSGPEGDEYLVIEIRPDRVEVVDLAPGSVFTPSRPVILERKGETWLVSGSG